MNTLTIVPLRTASFRAIRQSGAVLCKILSERTLISRFQYFIETTDWEKYLCHKVIENLPRRYNPFHYLLLFLSWRLSYLDSFSEVWLMDSLPPLTRSFPQFYNTTAALLN